jgi:hypothetical protein
MRDHEMSDESISEELHHASKCLRDQWIEKNFARKTFKHDKEIQNTRDDQMSMNRLYSSQDETRDSRDVELDDDTRLSSLCWVSYVHFDV